MNIPIHSETEIIYAPRIPLRPISGETEKECRSKALTILKHSYYVRVDIPLQLFLAFDPNLYKVMTNLINDNAEFLLDNIKDFSENCLPYYNDIIEVSIVRRVMNDITTPATSRYPIFYAKTIESIFLRFLSLTGKRIVRTSIVPVTKEIRDGFTSRCRLIIQLTGESIRISQMDAILPSDYNATMIGALYEHIEKMLNEIKYFVDEYNPYYTDIISTDEIDKIAFIISKLDMENAEHYGDVIIDYFLKLLSMGDFFQEEEYWTY